MRLKDRPILFNFIVLACVFILTLTVALIVNNMFAINNLNRQVQARSLTIVENAINFLEDRVALYAAAAQVIASNDDVRYLSLSRGTDDFNFFPRAISLQNTLINTRVINAEIADMLIKFDNMPVSFTSFGTWGVSHLSPYWEELHGVSLNIVNSGIVSSFFVEGDFVVTYNNIYRNTHVFVKVNRSAVESMLAQLVPESYGRFVAIGIHGDWMLSNIQNHWGNEPTVVITRGINRLYHFYANPLAHHSIINNMIIVSFGIMGGIIIITILLLFRIKKNLYDPLPQIINALSADSYDNKRVMHRGEFSQIFGAIDMMHISLSESSENQRQMALNKYINDEATEELEEEVKDRINLGSRLYAALVILFEDEEGNKDAERSREFMTAVERFDRHQIYGVGKLGLFYFFFNHSDEYEAMIYWLEAYFEKQKGYIQCGVSALHSGFDEIVNALDESYGAFFKMPIESPAEPRRPALWQPEDEPENACKIPASLHNQVISAAMEGDAAKLEAAISNCLKNNENVNTMEMRRLILYLYEAVCLVVGNGDASRRSFFENVYNPKLLIALISAELGGQIKSKDNDIGITLWVDENLHNDISLTNLAEAMSISYSYASRFFTHKVGMHFSEYLKKKRVERAMALLTETDKGIEEIAIDSGFVSVNTFFRVFKKYAGMPPGKYRACIKE